MNHFFFFGCWNRDNCNGKDYRKALFDTLKPISSTFNFGVIAGDNIYPHNKRYYKKTIYYGFSLLNELKNTTQNKVIYGTIGNHDVSRISILEYQIQSPIITMDKNMYIKQISPHLRILFIDTNLFSSKRSKMHLYQNNLEYLPQSVKHFFAVRNETEVLEEIDKLLSSNPSYSGWTIVVGHEPIFSIKPKLKKNIQGIDIKSWIPYESILNKLASIPKTIYMCADVHSFQAWNIKTKKGILPMIVSGTGGGEPDETLPIRNDYHINSQSLELIASEYPYGYCQVYCNASTLEIHYIPLQQCTITNPVKLLYIKNKLHLLPNKLSKNKNSNHSKCIAKDTNPKLCILDPSMEMMGGKKS